MSYAQTKINSYNASVDDEYQREQLHLSSTVGGLYTMWACFLSAGILAWFLPNYYSLFAMLPLFPPAIGQTMGSQWLAKNTPRPRYIKLTRGEWIGLIIILAVIFGGIVFNTVSDSLELSLGIICGGIVGGLAAGFLAPKAQEKARAMDQKRLDAELED